MAQLVESPAASMAEQLAALPEVEREALLMDMTEGEVDDLLHDWRFWARAAQIAPAWEWATWLILAGRGFGKTEAGANWINEREEAGFRMFAIVAETQKDLEEVMVPRIVKTAKPGREPTVRFKPVRISWPSGALAYGYVGNEPNQLRGPEFDSAWVDELAKYRKAQEAWDMLQFTMRAGDDPRVLVTTTPRPVPIIRALAKDPTTAVTKGSTMDNRGNLPPEFLRRLKEKYAGTRLGRQELEAEILDDLPGALWTLEMIDELRVGHNSLPDMQRIVVAVDPSGTKGKVDDNSEGGDDVGIVIAGLGIDGHAYILADFSCNLSPAGWGKRVSQAYHKWEADRVIGERNFGGAMVEYVIRSTDPDISYKEVTASRGKVQRAEPVAALYEQGRVHHYTDPEDPEGLNQMEDQMVQFGPKGYVGEGSPDRADAAIWAITELMLEGSEYTAQDMMAAV